VTGRTAPGIQEGWPAYCALDRAGLTPWAVQIPRHWTLDLTVAQELNMTRPALLTALLLPGIALAGDPLILGDGYGEDWIFDMGADLDFGRDESRHVPIDNERFRPSIVNGQVVPEGQYVEVVHLTMGSASGGGNCTGSLIHPEWVLTAGHCFSDSTTSITVTFGTNANASRKVQAADWIIHSGWRSANITNGTFNNDVALIRLADPVEDVFPMALNDQPVTDDWIDTPITFVGYGITRTGGGDSGTKRVAAVPLVGYARDRVFAFNGSQSTCQGDSGGPGMLFSGDGYVQISVTSYGAVPCGSGNTGHMRVDYFMNWIRDQGVSVINRAGSPPSFACSRELEPDNPDTVTIGIVPFDLRCEISYHSKDEITDVSWSWGDGTTSTGDRVEHTYEDSGNFTVRMCATGERDQGNWRHCVNRNGYVRACDIPDAAFTVEPVEKLQWRLVNLTDVTTYGCVTNIQWDIFDDAGNLVDSIQSWEPLVNFPSNGTYRIVLNVGGLAGTGASELTVDVRRGMARGCDTTASASGLGALALFAGLLGLRRRRHV
jgi:uncharacterized protein (TIGR03382 family)